MEEATTTKRKQTDDKPIDESNHKRLKIDNSIDECYILRLPECVLNVLLSYFDASSLYSLSQTCELFYEMTKQASFWRYIDARNAPHDLEKFSFCCKRMHEGTTHFLYKGRSRTVEVLSGKFFNKARLWSNLKVLALENQYICGNTYLLKFFPQSLEELSLRRTYVTNGFNFFRFSSSLEKLRVLILDHCQWFEASNLMSVANLKHLEILSLYMCKRLSDVDIGYLSLSGDYGLKNIKVLDVRFTSVGNQLLSSMYKSPTIQELYFQCYSTTYQLDKSKRKLELLRGVQQKSHSHMSDDDEENLLDTSERRMLKHFGDVGLRIRETDVVDDMGISMFKYVQADDVPYRRPDSFLFKYPYSVECTCGYYKQFWEANNKSIYKKLKNDHYSSDSDNDDNDNDERKKLKHTIKKRRRQLKMALKKRKAKPIYYVIYNTKDKTNDRTARFQWINERAPQSEEEMKMLEHTIVETPPDQGIIICGQTGHQYSFIGETFVMPNVYNSESSTNKEFNEKDTSDEEDVDSFSSSSDEEQQQGEKEAQFNNVAEPYLRICFRAQDPKVCCRLNKFSLRGYPKVTDASLQYLKDINLELLDVSYTNVTAKGVRDFMMVHPNCRVVHESACICGPSIHF